MKRLLKKLLADYRQKGQAMPETTSPPVATPPVISGGLTESQIAKIASDAVTTAIAAAMKPITDQLGTLAQGQAALTEAQKTAITADAIGKTVADAIEARSVANAATQAKADFVAANLKGVPQIYANQLGTDQSKWVDEAKTIRGQYQKDLTDQGIKASPISSDLPGAAAVGVGVNKPGDLVDMSKMSALQLIEQGVKQTGTPVPASAEQRKAEEKAKASEEVGGGAAM